MWQFCPCFLRDLSIPPCFLCHRSIMLAYSRQGGLEETKSIYGRSPTQKHQNVGSNISPAELRNLHRWQDSQSPACVFISGKSRYFGVTRSGFPTQLPSSFLLVQWSTTPRICHKGKLCQGDRNIYPNIYISYYCLYITSVVICYLFLEAIYSPVCHWLWSWPGKTATCSSYSLFVRWATQPQMNPQLLW